MDLGASDGGLLGHSLEETRLSVICPWRLRCSRLTIVCGFGAISLLGVQYH